MIENIVVGVPLVPLNTLLGDELNPSYNWEEVTIYENERYLPKLLVKYGFTKSISELKRTRKDLNITLDKLDCIEINFKKAKKKLYVAVGE